MGASKGNQWWRLRSKHGRDALFATPSLLWEAACEYFENCDSNPWIKNKEVSTDKGFSKEEQPVQKPYSRSGFFLYIGCSENWLSEFKKKADKDFLGVIHEIETIIDTQQFEGATVGAFNANIIARTLGLAEVSKTELSGQLEMKPITKEELSNIEDKLDSEL